MLLLHSDCAMFATSTVETEPFLCQEFLAFVQGSHTRAIFGDVVSFFAVNACSFTTFTVLGVIKFDSFRKLFGEGDFLEVSLSSNGLISFHFFNATIRRGKSQSCQPVSPRTRSALMPFSFSSTLLAVPFTFSSLNPCHTLLRSDQSLHCAGKVNKTQEDRGKWSKMVKCLKQGSS